MAESDRITEVEKLHDDHPADDTKTHQTLGQPREVTGTKLGENGNPLHTLATALDELEANEATLEGKGEEMAGKGLTEASDTDYILIDKEDALRGCLKLIEEAIKEEPIIALDCEGDDLSRKGKLLLMSVSTRKKAFLIDILALQSLPFDLGFRAILEDDTIKKLMFDCRCDSDALFHQFNVKLDGVLDIQLLEIIKRPPEQSNDGLKRRSERHDEVVRLRGQLWCIENLLSNKEMVEQKKKGKSISSDWEKRPLVKDQLEYAKTDVLSLFILYDKLYPVGEEIGRLEIASKVYVDLKRSIVDRNYGRYENHGFLPIDVIPEIGRSGFEYGYVACIECKRHFTRAEFSNTQISNGTPRCRTCKRVKRDGELYEEQRQAAAARSANRLHRMLFNPPIYLDDILGGYSFLSYDYDSDEYFVYDSD